MRYDMLLSADACCKNENHTSENSPHLDIADSIMYK